MADEAKLPEEQPAAPAETAPETPANEPEAPSPEDKPAEPTVAELLKPEEPKPSLVPEAALIGEKKGRKEAEKRIKELEAQIAAGATKREVSEGLDDIQAIAAKYGLDEPNRQFFDELATVLEARAERKTEEKLRPLEEKERAAKLDQIFSKHFNDALEASPEFKGIANASVIKTLSMAPENANKTFPQIIEETYGGAISGKRTIETTTPGGGKAPEPIDYERAKKDGAYVTEILKDPVKKAEYNKRMIDQMSGR